jgi:hypothetical protein
MGKVIIAVGNTELNNKLALHTTNQKVFVNKIFCSSGGSYVAVESRLRREFSVRVEPSRDSICRIIKQFEETRSLINVRRGVNVAYLFERKKESQQ